MNRIVANIEDLSPPFDLHSRPQPLATEAPGADPSPFPTDALPPVLAAAVREVSRVNRTPECMAGALVLAAVSISLGRNLCIKLLPNKITRGNLFLLIGAESGTGKSEVTRACLQPLHESEQMQNAQWKRDELPWIETRKELLENEIAKLVRTAQKPEWDIDKLTKDIAGKRLKLQEVERLLVEPRILVEDITPQKLAMLLQSHDETMAMVSSDGGDVVSNILGRYNKLDRVEDSLLVKSYSGDAVAVDRVGRESVFLASPCLTLALMLQPEKISTLFGEEDLISGGFLPRCLIVQTQAELQHIEGGGEEICQTTMNAYRDLIAKLLSNFRLGQTPHVIESTPNAKEVITHYYNQIIDRRGNDLADVGVLASRYCEQACRLAVVLHAAKHGKDAGNIMMEEDTVNAAIGLADFFVDQQLALLSHSRQELAQERHSEVLALLQKQPFITGRDVQRARITATAAEAHALLASLAQGGVLHAMPPEPGVHGATRYQ